MPKTPELTKEEIEFVSSIKTVIDKKVYDKVHQLSKLNPNIDHKAVENQCEEDFFKDMEKEMLQLANQMIEFFALLKEDRIDLYEKLRDSFNNKFENLDDLNESIKQCKRLEDFKKLQLQPFSEEEKKELYHLGEQWFDRNDFKKASLYFSFLTLLDSKNPQFWLARGMSAQNNAQYEEALSSYGQVVQLDSTLLLAYIQIIDCLLLISRFSEAKQLYEFFIHQIDKNDYKHDDFIMLKLKEIESIINKI